MLLFCSGWRENSLNILPCHTPSVSWSSALLRLSGCTCVSACMHFVTAIGVLNYLWPEHCGLIDLVHLEVVYTHTYNNTRVPTNRDETGHLEEILKVTAQSVTHNHTVVHSQTIRVGSDLQSGTLAKRRRREGSCVFVWLHLCVYLRLHINAIHSPHAISRCVGRNTQLWLFFMRLCK